MADDTDPAARAEAVNEAFAALADGAAVEAAREIEDAFKRTGQAVEDALVNAARTGEIAFDDLAKKILLLFAELAIDQLVAKPLGDIVERVLGGGGFSGARAAGGFVSPGGAYLVGETGPEVFTPAGAGSVAPVGAGAPVTVHFHLGAGADAQSIRRSDGQIAALVARAVARGRRDL